MKMATWITNKPERKRDELAGVRFFLKGMQVWPEDKDTWWRRLYFYGYMIPVALATFLEILFFIDEFQTADVLLLLQVSSDAIAIGSFVFKGYYARKNARTFLNISTMILTDFAKLEENHTAVRVQILKVSWLPPFAHFCLTLASITYSIASLWQPPETRMMSFLSPHYWNSNPYTFYPTFAGWMFCQVGMYSSNGSMDAIVVCLANLIREKALTCQTILKDLELFQNEKQRDAELSKAIQYHTLLMHVYDVTENLTNRPMLIQFIFLVVGIGTPALRLLLGDSHFEAAYLMFLFFYIVWVLSVVFVYFLMCDAATASAQGIGFAAYAAYRPGMTKDQVRKLCCIMGTAQRPMYFTARKLIKIDRKAMLKLMRRSYSFFSAVLKTR